MGEVIPLFKNKWYQSMLNVHALSDWMMETGKFDSVTDVTDYFKEPKKYSDEWVEFQEAKRDEGVS